MEREAVIIAGFGSRSDAGEAGLRDALRTANPRDLPLAAIAALAHKASLLAPLARALGLPLLLVEPGTIEGRPTLTISPRSLMAYGVGSVAEAVALAAAGRGARLIGPRVPSSCGQATCALAQGVSQ